MILGVRLKNETLQRAGLKIAIWQVHLLDHTGSPHASIWSSARTFRPSTLSLWNHTLFTIAYRLTKETGFQKLSEIAQNQFWDPSAFPIKLLVLVPSNLPQALSNPYRPFAEEMTVGLMKFPHPDFSFAATLSGSNSGLFSFHKKQVALVNAGPQVGSFDDSSQFGITRTFSKIRPFQEITWEKSAYHCQLKGWTQLSAIPVWLHMDARIQAGQLSMELSIQEKTLQDPVHFVLFLKCDKLVLGGKHHLETGTLERYDGRSLTLELQSGQEKMVIHPDLASTMQVIPLAGGDHFWGAQFLVALSINQNLCLEIK